MSPRLNLFLFLTTLPSTIWASATCTVTANNLAFGHYNFIHTTPTEITGNVQVSCTRNGLVSLLVNYEILLGPGSKGSYVPRNMTNGANQLQYNLYTDPTGNNVWGDNSSGTIGITDGYLLNLPTINRNYPVYGAIPAGQNLPAGIYSDSITVTINY